MKSPAAPISYCFPSCKNKSIMSNQHPAFNARLQVALLQIYHKNEAVLGALHVQDAESVHAAAFYAGLAECPVCKEAVQGSSMHNIPQVS
ncbi:MAG TPA: hypothetical protein VJZ68_04415 [Nitrososphaera sp.]|nr:hypothetical protein [Nitrososphaera sp.]